MAKRQTFVPTTSRKSLRELADSRLAQEKAARLWREGEHIIATGDRVEAAGGTSATFARKES